MKIKADSSVCDLLDVVQILKTTILTFQKVHISTSNFQKLDFSMPRLAVCF